MLNFLKNKRIIAFMVVAVWLIFSAAAIFFWVAETVNFNMNTYTVGDVEIKLTENLHIPGMMLPGSEEVKDPKIRVMAGSRDCWLFVEITEATGIENYVSYATAKGWKPLEGHEGVFYQEVKRSKKDQLFPILEDGTVTINDIVVEEQFTDIIALPDVKIVAFAVEMAEASDVQDAWNEALSAAKR